MRSSGSWSTVDNFTLCAGRDNYANAIGLGNSSAIFAVGTATDCVPVSSWYVRKSTDEGASWSVSDSYTTAFGDAFANAFYKDTSGNLWVMGNGVGPTTYDWIVRESTDNGASWIPRDDYDDNRAFANGMTQDLAGNLYVAGYGNDIGVDFLEVRRSTDGGATWSTVDNIAISGNSTASAAIGRDLVGNLFAVGFSGTGPAKTFAIRQSADGTTWNTGMMYQYTGGFPSGATGFTVDTQGNLYLSGYGQDASTFNHWLILKSVDDGVTWALVDDFQYASNQDSQALSIGIDQCNGIYVSGFGTDGVGSRHSIVRWSTNKGVTWSTSDDFQVAAASTYTNGLFVLPSGNLFLAGAYSTGPQVAWFVRKF